MTDKKTTLLRESKTARWAVLILVSITMLFSYYLYDAMAPLQQNLQSKLNWSATEYGIFSSGYGWFNVFLLMLVFGGMILDKMGTRFTGILSIVIMLIGAGIKYYAISGNVSGSFEYHIGSWQLISPSSKSALLAGLGFAIFGVGSEMYGIAANKAVVRWFRGKEMAMAIGLNTSTGRIGTFLAMATPVPLYNLTGNIGSPVLISIFCLAIGLLTYILFNMLDKKLDQEEKESGIAEDEEFRFSDIKEISKNKAFWYIAALCLLFYSAVNPFLKFATQLITQKYEVSDTLAGLIPSLLPLCAMFLTPLFGSITDKKGRSASIMIWGSIIVILIHLLFAIPSLNNFTISIALVIILGISFSLVPAAMWPSVAKIIPMNKLGTAYAMIFWIQNWGLMGVPLLIGWVLDKYCISGYTQKMIDGKLEKITMYNYSLPMILFAVFGMMAIGFAFLLKAEDKKMSYGLENPNEEE